MESKSHNLTEVKGTNEKTLAGAKIVRGMSLRACVAAWPRPWVGPLRRPMLYLFKRQALIKHHDFE